MRLKNLYIFIIVLSLLIPQNNDQDDNYDTSGSTDFVEKLPIINRFYSFTKNQDDSNKETI